MALYEVEFLSLRRVFVTVEADSPEEAKALADELVDEPDDRRTVEWYEQDVDVYQIEGAKESLAARAQRLAALRKE